MKLKTKVRIEGDIDMNLLEKLVHKLPEKTQKNILQISEKSDMCRSVNCASIEAIDDYISELTMLVIDVAHIGVELDSGDHVFELSEYHIEKARLLIE